MRATELIVCVAAIFLVTATLGNGAPQWRPQGRFGKRIDPLLVLLSHTNLQDEADDVPLFADSSEHGRLSLPVRLDNLMCLPLGFRNAYRCNRNVVSSSQDEMNAPVS